jgi:Tfp pilus assembly protein PilO
MNLKSTNQRIGLVTAGAALVLVVVWYLALWSPQGHKLTQAHADQTKAAAQVTHLQAQVAGLQALVRNIPADKTKLGQYTAAVPDNPQLPAALDQIQSAASTTRVTLSSISPSGAPSSAAKQSALNGVPGITVSMAANGTYPELMSFITSLNSMPRTLVITNLSLSGSGSGSVPTMTASISTDIFDAGQPTP